MKTAMTSSMAADMAEPTETESGVSGEVGSTITDGGSAKTAGNAAGSCSGPSLSDGDETNHGRDNDSGELHCV
jgi:hypothetical protein